MKIIDLFQIWLFCEQRDIWILYAIYASYITSKDNVDGVDGGSRVNNIDTKWDLTDWAFMAEC